MSDFNFIKYYFKGLEDQIEQQFGSHAGYRQVQSVLEGSAEEVDTRTLITDARAVLSGANKPELLAAGMVGVLQMQFNIRSGIYSQAMEKAQEDLAARLEKKRAILENRTSRVTAEAAKGESLIVGRLVAADGATPVEGARVVVRGTGSQKAEIIATVSTDENGEYAARLDDKILATAPKEVALTFEAKNGEEIASSTGFALVKGQAKSVDLKVAEDKTGLAAELMRSEDERKVAAINALAELTRRDSELKALHFQTGKSLDKLNATFEGLKNLFTPDEPQ